MRFHIVSLPHTQSTKEYLSCAYTQKVLNFCRMMKSLDHEVFLYASEDNDAPCDELIPCITKEEQKLNIKQADWKKDFFSIEWDENISYWRIMNGRAITEIGKRIQKKDFICVIAGTCQKPIADAFPAHMTVEFGIGYEGTFSNYRVFESYAFMHYLYGIQGTKDGKYYDTVIPNYFDPKDFYLTTTPEPYFLFIGRLVPRKGLGIAADVCKKLGVKLKVAGQGMIEYEKGKKIKAQEFTIEGDIEYLGTVGVKERADLMSKAMGVFVETQYIGPFEGVSVEAMLSGTPVLTTDWGCFVETVIDGVTGFRTRTMGETIWAARECQYLDRKKIRDYAVKRYSMDSVKYRYQDYFTQLLDLWDKGWETLEYNPDDKRLMGNFI